MLGLVNSRPVHSVYMRGRYIPGLHSNCMNGTPWQWVYIAQGDTNIILYLQVHIYMHSVLQ